MMTGAATVDDDLVVVDLRGQPPGARLRLRRRALGFSQWELAKALGTTQSTVSLAERGRVDAGPLERALQRLLAETRPVACESGHRRARREL